VPEKGLIPDDEYILRHIPGGTFFQAPGPRITSGNFILRTHQGEIGVSVTRLSITSPARLLELVGGKPEAGSRVAGARVADIRAMGLRVVPKPLPEDRSHSEIQSDTASLDDHKTQKQLARLFQFVEDRPPPAAATVP
jgi:hypothetical protein